MDREGFHPEYHDDRFYGGALDDEDDLAEEPERGPGFLARLREWAGVAERWAMPALALLLVLSVGYALLPGGPRDAALPGPSPKASQPSAPADAAAPRLLSERPLPPSAYGPPPEPPTVGAEATSVLPAPGPERVLDLAGRALRLATRDIIVAAPTWKEPRTLSLPLFSVDRDGRVVEATPSAGRLAALCAAIALAYLAGAGLGWVGTYVSERGLIPYEGYESGAGRLVAGVVTLVGTILATQGDPDEIRLVLGAAAAATLWAGRGARRRALVAGLATVAAGLALVVPVVEPHAALATDYGPLGLRVWDVLACGAFAVLALLWLLPRRRTAPDVHVHAPQALVQDVRVVEDRRRPG